MYLLDTNVISETMRKSPSPKVMSWVGELDILTTSVICLEELIFGLRRRSLHKKEAWLRRLLADKGVVHPVTDTASHWSGEKRSALESQRRAVTQADALIAAAAWEHGLILATRNIRNFEGFGVPLFNPFD